ncbi:MAG TPA: MFS transporter [Spongiibacteraceae bacterium]|nr:MFS transporter [Spongiibacteraceae bacterium]
MTRADRKVIFASALGTMFEWYDFFLYGSLAAITSKQFFSGVNDTAAFIFALLAFSAGFAVRPFGALVFGRLGDMVGRKHTFLITIVIMGASTFLVGCLPSYNSIGVAAPITLVLLRLLQGLALGGEYGGAATYVAEHAPHGRRGLYTGWIQTTANIGLLLSLAVIIGTRTALGEEQFAAWGWRIPFLLSILLLAVSVYIRLSLNESPVFQRIKAEGKTSKAPLRETFGNWRNVKLIIVALLGLTAGQATAWYTGQFYTLFFLTQTLKVDGLTANLLIGAAVAITTPLFVIAGAISDRIGRKPVILCGCLLAGLTYLPIFKAITQSANPALASAQQNAPVQVFADPATCSFQFNPVGTSQFTTSCDIAKAFLTKNSVNYSNRAAATGSIAAIKIGDITIDSFEGSQLSKAEFDARSKAFNTQMTAAIRAAGYPEHADANAIQWPKLVALLTLLGLYSALTYGPIAAALVELFPTRIRYTAMSMPYHIGSGWVGGLLPATAFAMVAAKGDIYFGLWYPAVCALATFVVGIIFIPETKDRDIYAND